MAEPTATDEELASVAAWARSGAMSLTGPEDGPGLGPPAPLVPRLTEVAARLQTRATNLGRGFHVEPLVLLTERAAIAGLARHGQESCGRASRLLRTADGWLALTLARADDVDLVPAWLELAGPPGDVWDAVREVVAGGPAAALVERGAALGLPLAAVPPPGEAPEPVVAHRLGDRPATTSLDGVVVADLGSLWAGPSCGALLADAGATVVKVESTARPDGARQGPREFFDLVNAGKHSVALDLTTDGGRSSLRRLLAAVDVVVEASRPRALEQLGIDAEQLVRGGGPAVWASITAHGRDGAGRDRVGFGDDAAVGGGLVAWDGEEPCFCADAVADPATGLVAATAVLDALASGARWLLDVAMSRVAAHLAGPTLPVPPGTVASPPARRAPRGEAAELGQHTAEVLRELGVAG